MYHWFNNQKFSNMRNSSDVDLNHYSMNVNLLTGKRSSYYKFCQLPVIKEEGSVLNEEIVYTTIDAKESCSNSKSLETLKNKKTNQKPQKKNFLNNVNEVKPITKLPPILNINCMMNAEVKQSQAIWETSFGKKLIGQYDVDEYLSPLVVKKNIEKVLSPNAGPKEKSKNKIILNNSCSKRNKNGGGDGEPQVIGHKGAKKNNKAKVKKFKNIKQDKNKIFQNKNVNNKNKVDFSQNSDFQIENSVSNLLSADTSMVSSLSKNKHFLTECIKDILDSVTDKISCEICDETFPTAEDLLKHVEIHEKEKQVCLLCDKVFYKGNDFVLHLLSHEGVDRFSCKKCKKYFPTSKKYKQHLKESHFIPSEANEGSQFSQCKIDYVNKRMPKLNCKRCKEVFSSEESLRSHRRSHIKMDLMGAYLLNSEKL